MKKLIIISIICLFSFQCEKGWLREIVNPTVEGCSIPTACNYNPDVNKFDNSCEYASCIDCLGMQHGVAILDSCGTCDAVASNDCEKDCEDVWGGGKIEDCAGVCNGTNVIDNCNACDADPTNDCNADCAGIWGGSAIKDECNICSGDNSTCRDCNNEINGTAYYDGCNECVGGNTGKEACPTDCAGVDGGTSFYDDCGICVSDGDVSCVQGCDGNWENDGTQFVLDECNVCNGDNACLDCAGTPNGDAVKDNCDTCDADPDNDCVQDCEDVWGGSAEIDICGVCNGDGDCEGIDCTDNSSDYCQNLSVLQIFIDNSLETINMDMDDNGDGIIEPLELGIQSWQNGRITSFTCRWLDADWNYCQLSGEIPEEIGNLTNLTNLNLYDNELTEGIPSEIGNLTNLTHLNLGFNELTGEIPPEIWEMTNLTYLYLSSNQLTGEIPVEIGNLVNLTYLGLTNNELTGEIPSEIGNLTSLTSLNLGRNELTGEIPSEIGNLTSLTYLRLFSNELTGEIPSEIGNLTSLTSLSLYDNKLSGEIPSEICNQGDPDPQLANNQLCPPYPSCLTAEDIGEQDTSECLLIDCAGDWGGSAVEDCTGLCGGPYTDCSVYDIDGNGYTIVTIGTQEWLVQNLKTTHYNDGSEIPTGHSNEEWANLSIGAYAVYDVDPANADIYGYLYNWYVVDDSRGLCMEGFHVPTDEEWTILTDYLGGESVAGGKMKETGTAHWNSPNTDATNESDFTCLPGGYRNGNTGDYGNSRGIIGSFWSSSDYYGGIYAYYRTLYYDKSIVYRSSNVLQAGKSIRCLGD